MSTIIQHSLFLVYFFSIHPCKRYGRRVNIIAYIDFDDGRKVVCSAYSSKNYLGLKDIEMGSRVEVSFAPNTNGKVQLTAIAVIE